jgi:hypothetical protein
MKEIEENLKTRLSDKKGMQAKLWNANTRP